MGIRPLQHVQNPKMWFISLFVDQNETWGSGPCNPFQIPKLEIYKRSEGALKTREETRWNWAHAAQSLEDVSFYICRHALVVVTRYCNAAVLCMLP